MVVVPALSERQQSAVRHVESLHRGAAHAPRNTVAHARMVREVADEPMAGHACRHAATDAPRDPTPTAEREKQQRPRHLLKRRGAFQESVEAAVHQLCWKTESRWIVEFNLTMQLPIPVPPEGRAMAEEWVAMALPLGPIPKIMGPHHCEGAAEPHQGSQIDAHLLHPSGTRKAAVNEQAVHAQGVAEAQRDGAECEKHRHGLPRVVHGAANHPAHQHADVPRGFSRPPAHAARRGIATSARDDAFVAVADARFGAKCR